MKYTMLFLVVLITAWGCQQKGKSGQVLDTPTTGSIKIMVDDAYKPIVETSIDVFDSVYRRAKIEPIYLSEGEAVNALLRDSIQVIIITRQLTSDELTFFTRRGFKPKMTAIAHDAVAFIVNPNNRDTVFTTEQLQKILSGEILNWKGLNSKSALGQIRLVFDHALSGTVRFAKDSIAGGKLSPQASALKTNEEVINYVSKNPASIGIIGANWISDTDDKGVQNFLRQIKIVDIASAPGKTGYGPYQAYLANGSYPYKRTVYIIDAQARNGLGLGFASFLAGPDGQRIVLKDGLLPAQAVTRLIQVSKE